jgi:4'-phosphopantetheinyl transferase
MGLEGMERVLDSDIAVFWMNLTPPSGPLLASLDATEMERARGYMRTEDRWRFEVGAGVLRAVMGAMVGVKPADVVVERRCRSCSRPHGRPRVVGSNFDLSISHSGKIVGVALSKVGAVGLDVQDFVQLDPLVFGPLIAGSDCPELDSESLLRTWVRKEALVKATGEGLNRPFADIEITADDDGAIGVSRYGQDTNLPWQIRDLPTDPGYFASVSVLSSEPIAVVEHWLDRESLDQLFG